MLSKTIDIPRILIAALRGGSGKTVISIGIIAALEQFGKTVAPFKKGPDYIDAGWLALAAGRPCHNLDPFLFSESSVCRSFIENSRNANIAVIEGNRGLYDGLDEAGTTSTASLSKLIGSPVVLCLDCTKSTRTMAAVVLGCLHYDPSVNIAAVILNRVAGSRHERILRQCIESDCGIPVVGAIPKLSAQDFPERHMGLIPTPEHTWASQSIESAMHMARNHIDLEEVMRIAGAAAKNPVALYTEDCYGDPNLIESSGLRPRIGIIRDSAFQFYYPENITALERAGAELVYISPLAADSFPDVDALYIGGGFPETHAGELSENLEFRNAVKMAAHSGLPIYAECGGLMFLGEALKLERTYPMAGVLPVVFGFSTRPQGHGYTIAIVNRENPYFSAGKELKGHEFHYSRVIEWRGNDTDLVFTMQKGRGIVNGKDGICIGNVLATYTHLHALGCPEWAAALVRLARVRRRG